MKKIIKILIFVIILAAAAGLGGFYYVSNTDGHSRVTNDAAQADTQGRYLTIINATNQIINEVHITVGEGTEIEHNYQENPDETSFSIPIPESYQEYQTFIVTLIDRYGMKYQKEVANVPEKGRTEVSITEDDYVKQDGDLKRQIDRFFNGD